MADFTSEFNCGEFSCSQSNPGVSASTSNNIAPASAIEFGNDLKAGANEGRVSAMQAFDLGDPVVGLPIPKQVVIEDIYFEFTPTINKDGDEAHSMTLLAADGHWDRSVTHPLSSARDGVFTTYSSPSFGVSTEFKLHNSDLVKIADTMDQTTDPVPVLFLTALFTTYQTLGTTILVPAGESVGRCTVRMNRHSAATTSPDVELHVNVYTLTANGRQYAIDELIASSESKNFTDLTVNDTAITLEDFDFTVPIPAVEQDRWILCMVEGEIATEANAKTGYFIAYRVRKEYDSFRTAYSPGSDGSIVTGSTFVDVRYPNAFSRYYYQSQDLPTLYGRDSNSPLVTPYSRTFGTEMSVDAADIVDFVAGVSLKYGSPGTSPDVEFPNIVKNVQAWVDSVHYDPTKRRNWLGMVFEFPSAISTEDIYTYDGPQTSNPIKIVIDWSPADPSLIVPGDVKDIKYVDLAESNYVAGLWTVIPRQDFETLNVPGLDSVESVASLTDGATVSGSEIIEGQSMITISGTAGQTVTFSTLHRKGLTNYLSLDEDPGV